MRLRTLLAATVTSALAVGVAGVPALATTVPDPARAGTLTTWGFANANGGPAMAIPEDLTGPVRSVAASNRATGVVTVDGHVRVWGAALADEANEVPSGITEATTISLSINHGAVLHQDGRITAWGAPDGVDPSALSEVPTDLRAKAIAIQVGTGYAVTTGGTLTTWGDEPAYPAPAGSTGWTDLVDVSASPTQIMVLHADGTVDEWGYDDPEGAPGLLDVPDFAGKKAVKIATGGLLSGVIFEDGTIDVWGTGIPDGEPTFDGLTPAGKVVSLGLWANAAAVTADGKVHAWGAIPQLNSVPSSLDDMPVSAVAMGNFHAAAVVTVFREVTKPTIAGQPKVGQTLTATPATYSLTPDAPATGQWYAGNDPIAGKTGTTLALDATLVGKSVSYRTTATRGDDTVTSASAPVGPVAPATVASTTTLSVSPASAAVGTARTVTATVAKTGGTATGSVTFTLGSTTATAALTAGKATWTLPALAVGSHSVTAKYTGDSSTDPSTSAAASVTVTKAEAKVSAKAKATGKSKKTAKKVTITVTVKTTEGVSPAGKVTVTLKGKTKKTVKAKVNAKGKATVTIKKIKRGKYKATLSYAGNDNVSAASGKASFKV